jgi:hypothetical protein
MEPEGSPNLVEPPKQIANETAEQKLYRKVCFFSLSISPNDDSEWVQQLSLFKSG